MSKTSQIPGYSYDDPNLPHSPVSDEMLQEIKTGAGLTEKDERYLRLAGEVLQGQTHEIVQMWRSQIIAGIPHLARHSRSLDGTALPDYLARSNVRFEQWILDTCLRPYDRSWLDYQHEIALRHTSAKKNKTDGVSSTPHIPLHDIIPFVAVMNETIKPFLGKKGHSPQDIEGMHKAWMKSMQIQIALWTKAYSYQ